MSDLAYALRVYFLPVLVIGGSVLNMLSFAVMRRIRSSITSNYMATLGLVDSGVLIIGGVSLWMHTVDSNFSFPLLSTMTCKLVPFALYTLADLSVFIIVIMTAERFYAVWRPLQASKRGKKRDFKMAMLASILICAAINSHFVFTHSTRRAKVLQIVDEPLVKPPPPAPQGAAVSSSITSAAPLASSLFVQNGEEDAFVNDPVEPEKYEQLCIDVVWHTFYEKYWMFIDATIYSFAPLILLTLFNIAIIRYLFKAADESLKLKETHKSSFSLSPPLTPAFVMTSSRASSPAVGCSTSAAAAGIGVGMGGGSILIQQNSNNSKTTYHTLKVPAMPSAVSKYRSKKSGSNKMLTVSYMKTYIEEDEEENNNNNNNGNNTTIGGGASSSLLKRTPSCLTTDTCLMSTSPSNHKSLVSNDFGSTSPSRRASGNGMSSGGNVPNASTSLLGAGGGGGGVGGRSLRSNSNITIRSVNSLAHTTTTTHHHHGPSQPFKRLNTRITVMLITLNITFCIFSMPMVILQIIYFSFYPFLEATSYYMFYTTTSDAAAPTTTPSYSPFYLTTTPPVPLAAAPTASLLANSSSFFLSSLLSNYTNTSFNSADYYAEAMMIRGIGASRGILMDGININNNIKNNFVGVETSGSEMSMDAPNTRHMVYDIPVDEKMLAKVDLIKCIAELLQYLNHSTNFFLYSLSGKTFRNETKAFILHHLNVVKAFFRNKKLKYFLHTAQSSSSSSNIHNNQNNNLINHHQNQQNNDPEQVRLRKELKKRLKSQNSFKYSFRTNLV